MYVCFKCLGDVELVNGITSGSSVLLIANLFPAHMEFFELSFEPGNTYATVRTKKELDAEAVADVSVVDVD